MKTIYVIIGLPSAGGRLLIAAMQALGIDRECTINAAEDFSNNELFLDSEFSEINKNFTQHSVKLKKENFPAFNTRKEQIFHSACELMKVRLLNEDHYVFKQMFPTHVLSFWEDVWNKLDIQVHYLLALRNPLFYAENKSKHSHFDRSLLRWMRTMVAIVAHIQKKSAMIIDYDEHVKNPKGQLRNLAKYFQLSNFYREASYNHYCQKLLTEKFIYRYHFKYLDTHSACFSICQRIYKLLLKIACQKQALSDESTQIEWILISEYIKKNESNYKIIQNLITHYELEIKKIFESEHPNTWTIKKDITREEKYLKNTDTIQRIQEI